VGLASAQTIAGAKTFNSPVYCNGALNAQASFGGSYTTNQLNVSGTSFSGIGFNSGGIGGQVVFEPTAVGFQFRNFNSTAYVGLYCTTVTQSSDVALKADIAPVSDVLPKLRGKRAVTYTLKADPDGVQHLGVIAQEWQEDFPQLVADIGADIDEDGDFIAHQYDADGNEIFGTNGKPESRKALGFNYGNAAAVALQGVIDLDAALTEALGRIAALEGKSTS
jgi:hypothetical protein